MADVISDYFLTRTDGTATTTVTICFPWDDSYGNYTAFQVYVDEALACVSPDSSFVCEIPTNKKVDILGLTEYFGDPDIDYSDQLDDSWGDKAVFLLPESLLGLKLRFFTADGLDEYGAIDYTKPIYDIDTTDLPLVFDELGYETLTVTEYEFLDVEEYEQLRVGNIGLFGRIIFTNRLNSGTYSFGVVAYDGPITSYPFEWTQTIVTRPDEITPRIVGYNSTTDLLTITAKVVAPNIAGATYNVYVGQWDGDGCSIDYTTPYVTSSSPTINIEGLRGTVTDGTLPIAMRATQNGQEEKNFNVVYLTVTTEVWVDALPAAPDDLTATLEAFEYVKLTWEYERNTVVPQGFNVYSDGGTGVMDYTRSIAIVPYRNKVNNAEIVGPIAETTQYGVRAYNGSLESQNTDTVFISPIPEPTEPTGDDGISTWRDEWQNFVSEVSL